MDPNPKQQVSEQLKNAKSILVTTSNNPSVDDVASVMGLTHLLQAMKKHASAVVSSSTPAALKFLNPDDIIENSTDKLRDFVVSFDKEKADKLRYKVEDDQVKIFITPYKTVISQEDFHFTQGDFHVDTIVVIGATKREELDPAVLKHSRILHEAEVITINAGPDQQSNMGSINWHDGAASSVSELLVSISEALGSGLLGKDSAQVLLTGIVAATDMFSNTVTSPKVMTMAAQLMAAGADQQQIMKELKAGEAISEHAQELTPEKKEEATTPSAHEAKSAHKQDDDVMLDLGSSRKTNEATKKEEPQAPTPAPAKEPAAETALPQQPQPAPKSTQPATQPPSTRENKHKIITGEKPNSQKALDHHAQHLGSTSSAKGEGASTAASQQQPPQSNKQKAPASHTPATPPQRSSELPEPPNPQAKTPTPAQSEQASSDAHVNVHPELPTLSKPKEKQQPAPSTHTAPTPTQKQPDAAAPKQPPATQQPNEQSKPQAKPPEDEHKDSADELEAARKAVQDAIASQPSPLPAKNESINSKEVPEDGGGIQIDHEGNIRM